MNMDIVGGKWKQLRGRMRQNIGRLLGNRFGEFNGQQDVINGKLQEYRGRAHATAYSPFHGIRG